MRGNEDADTYGAVDVVVVVADVVVVVVVAVVVVVVVVVVVEQKTSPAVRYTKFSRIKSAYIHTNCYENVHPSVRLSVHAMVGA